MREALLGPVLVAAGVLCVSATAKLRAPRPAVGALVTLGLPASAGLVRVLAALELVLGASVLIAPARSLVTVLAAGYLVFAAMALTLMRRRAACGCFGEGTTPAWRGQVVLSLATAGLCAAGAAWPPHGLAWVLARSPGLAAASLAGLAACVYAAVLVYTALPGAWAAWSGR